MQEGLGAVQYAVLMLKGEGLARLESSSRGISSDVRDMLFVLFANCSARLERFLKNPSDTIHPHRVFDERGGQIDLRRTPLLAMVSMCHCSRKLPSNGKPAQSIAPNNRRLSEQRLHVKTQG